MPPESESTPPFFVYFNSQECLHTSFFHLFRQMNILPFVSHRKTRRKRAKTRSQITTPSSFLMFLMDSPWIHDSIRSLALLGLKPPVAFGKADWIQKDPTNRSNRRSRSRSRIENTGWKWPRSLLPDPLVHFPRYPYVLVSIQYEYCWLAWLHGFCRLCRGLI